MVKKAILQTRSSEMNVGFVGYMVIMGQGSPNSIFGSNKCQLVSFQIRKHLYWLLRQFVHWFVHERHFRIFTIQMGTPPPSRFPCCVLSYFSLVFVMEHSRRWQLHIGGSKMFEPLFRAGLSFSSHFFCKIFVFDISKLNIRGHFLVGSAD